MKGRDRERIVTGDHAFRQEVRFEALRQRDADDYGRDDAAAKVMLRDLVVSVAGAGNALATKLAGFDVYVWDQCYAMEQSLRIE